MRALICFVFLLLMALGLSGCGESPPTPQPTEPGATTADALATPSASQSANLDTEALRTRAADSLSANRLYSPAGNNAVEDYLALDERQPDDPSVATALADLAPYVIIGAEQATAAEAFAEATRLIDLLARMDPQAPAVPRLRDALLAARADADARVAAEQAEAEQARAPSPSPAPTASAPTPNAASAPALTAEPAGPPARPARASTPIPVAPPTSAPAARALVSRVTPRFPEAAVRRRLEGEVEVAVRIRADGTVEAVEVVRADPPGVFDREAVLAVRRWRYAPAEAASDTRVVLQFKRA